MTSVDDRIFRLRSRTVQRNILNGKYVKPSASIVKLMLDDQVGRCAICEVEFSDTVRYAVDHCHVTRKVRGILCISCNSGLGMFNDQTRLLEIAIHYLNGKIKFRG